MKTKRKLIKAASQTPVLWFYRKIHAFFPVDHSHLTIDYTILRFTEKRAKKT